MFQGKKKSQSCEFLEKSLQHLGESRLADPAIDAGLDFLEIRRASLLGHISFKLCLDGSRSEADAFGVLRELCCNFRCRRLVGQVKDSTQIPFRIKGETVVVTVVPSDLYPSSATFPVAILAITQHLAAISGVQMIFNRGE